jgi:hypothetical protein
MIPWLDLPFEHSPWMSYFYTLQAVLTLLCVIDFYRRGAEPWWIWIILFFQPLGTWAYFVIHVLPRWLPRASFGRGSDQGWWQPRASVDELRFRVERTPTLVNHLAYAERLIEVKQHDQAVLHLQEALQIDEMHCPTMYHLAECRLALGETGQAIALLERLIQRDRAWSHYRAWQLLIQAHEKAGDRSKALDACHELQRFNPTWETRCMLAEHLLDNGQQQAAARLLREGLDETRYFTLGQRFKHWSWIRHAKRLLAEAEKAKS